uniref:Uncharacterized protein n=1 Tax=Avena sativa TaxID=4498 RepID=A0ACD5VCC2_AVESA
MFSFSSQKKTSALGGIFDNKDTTGGSSKSTFQFGGNNGFSTPTTLSIFSSPGSQSFSMPTPTLFSANPQPILTGIIAQDVASRRREAEEEVLHGSAGAEVEGGPRKHWVKYQMRLIGFENLT